MVLSIYVDVILLGVNADVVKPVPEQLMAKFLYMTDLGSASLVLGREIDQGEGYIKFSQGNHARSVLERSSFVHAKPSPTPGV